MEKAQAEQAAIDDFTVYLEMVPDDYRGWFNRGNAYLQAEKYAKAREDFTRTLELNPDFPAAYINRAITHEEQGQDEAALGDYEAALTLGEVPRAHNGAGEILRRLGRYEEARDHYQSAILLIPGYARAHAGLAGTYLELGEYENAIEAAGQAMAVDQEGAITPFALETRGRALYSLGNYPQVIADLDQSLRLRPALSGIYHRGVAYQANGQRDMAIRDLQSYLSQSEGRGDETPYIADAQARLAALLTGQ
ncbi:MAG: tetratricopeptide repeat protein [Ardenticatenales bacterium]|nr:tetratricopeptide repeat protein [Ardenticatenales bacterium]